MGLILLPNVEVASLLDKRAIDRLGVLIGHIDGVVHRQKLLVGHTHGLRLHVELGLDAGQETNVQCKSMLCSISQPFKHRVCRVTANTVLSKDKNTISFELQTHRPKRLENK